MEESGRREVKSGEREFFRVFQGFSEHFYDCLLGIEVAPTFSTS